MKRKKRILKIIMPIIAIVGPGASVNFGEKKPKPYKFEF